MKNLRASACRVLFCLLLCVSAVAQKRDGQIDFGSYGSRSCKVYRDHPDELSANYISAYTISNQIGVGYEFSWNYFRNRYAFGLAADVSHKGFCGGSVSGMFFVKQWEKQSDLRISGDFNVSTGVTSTRAGGKIEVTKQIMFGINVKNSLVKNTEGSFGKRINNELYSFDKIQYDMLEFGPVLMTVKGAEVKLNRFIGRTKRVVAAFNLVVTPWTGSEITFYDSTATPHPAENVSPEEILDSPMGFHFYIERYSNFVYHKDKVPVLRFGWYWRLGVIKPPFAWVQSLVVDEEILVKPEIGIGFFVNFD